MKPDKEVELALNSFERIRCIACGGRAHTEYGRFNSYLGLQCGNCKLVFVDEIPAPAELEEFYTDGYYEGYYGGMGYERFYEQHLKADFAAKMRLLSELNVHANSSILEIGCGPGYFLRELRDAGYSTARGWEISDAAIDSARELGVDVEKIDMKAVPPDGQPFDVVISWATIEHIPDPDEFFTGLWKLVGPGGLLLLDTGVTGTLRERLCSGMSGWFYPPEHLYVFSESSLRMLAERHGAKVQIRINISQPTWKRCMDYAGIGLWLVVNGIRGRKVAESCESAIDRHILGYAYAACRRYGGEVPEGTKALNRE